MAAALFGLLRGAGEEAMFVCVLAAVGFDAAVLEGAEDAVWAVVGGEVFFVLGELGLVVVEFCFGGLELRLCVGDVLWFCCVAAGRGIGEDAVFDKSDAKVTQFGIDPVADRGREIFFELVD